MLFEWCVQAFPSGHVGPPATAGNKRWLGNTLTCSHGRFGCTHFGRDVGHPTDQTYFLRGWRETDWTGRPARPIGCDPREPYTPSLAAANRLDSTYCASLCRAPLYGCTRSREGPWPPDQSNLGDHSPWLPPPGTLSRHPLRGDVTSGGSRPSSVTPGQIDSRAGLVSPHRIAYGDPCCLLPLAA